MEKKKFYVNIATGEISRNYVGNNNSFTIQATVDEVIFLREQLDGMHDAGIRSFFRAHVPMTLYSSDQANDEYDGHMIQAYKLLYQLGDERTKAHIDGMEFLVDEIEKE